MWRGVAVLALAVRAVVTSGCGDAPLPASVESFCGGVCAGAARCSPGLSRSTCESRCLADPENRELSTIRPEVAAAVGACLAQENCNTIFNGPFDACWDRARAEVPPSAHLLAFCPGYATSAFDCGYWFPVEECQTALNVWSDDFLDGLAACTQEATCDAADACIEARFKGN